jgi:hypothetical protein
MSTSLGQADYAFRSVRIFGCYGSTRFVDIEDYIVASFIKSSLQNAARGSGPLDGDHCGTYGTDATRSTAYVFTFELLMHNLL